MQLKFSLALLVSAGINCPASSLRSNVRGAAKLQPQVVAHTLFQMENEWRSQAEVFAECNATKGGDCSAAPHAFHESCVKVVSAVETASSGDRSVVKEYMGNICGQAVLDGWRKERCQSLATTITGVMTADNFENRESLDVAGVCQAYWSSFSATEAARVRKELAEAEVKRVAREAEEKKLAEERAAAAKKLAEERAAAAKKAAEQAAKLEQQRKAEEAARREADAKRKAAEEKKKAAEEKQKEEKEAAELKAKEEKALRKAEEAKHRMEEAKAAADAAHQQRAATAAKVNATSAEKVHKAVNATTAVKPVMKDTNATKSAKK